MSSLKNQSRQCKLHPHFALYQLIDLLQCIMGVVVEFHPRWQCINTKQVLRRTAERTMGCCTPESSKSFNETVVLLTMQQLPVKRLLQWEIHD